MRASVRAERAALLLAVVLVQGAVFEAAMRWYGGTEATPVFQQLFMQDPRIGHRPRPGARIHYATREFATDIAINADGVRGDDFAPRGPRERRIAVLGDSIVLSVQVDVKETFCQRLEAALNARQDGSTYRVINAGVQGYGPVEEWLFFEHVIAPLEPGIVLVAVFVANDAIEALDARRKLEADRSAATRVREDTIGWARRLVRRSMVLQTLRLRYEAVRAGLQDAPGAERPLMTYLADPPPEVDAGLRLARDVFGRLVARAEAKGARAAFVLVPARFQLDDADYGRLAATVTAAGGTLDRDAATRRFADALAPLDRPILDLLPILRREPQPVDLFFRENIHFTPRGHAVVARALERFLEEAALIDRFADARGAAREPR